MINIYEPNIAPYTKSAIDAINSGWISNHGTYVEKSKTLIQTTFNMKHAILMANGTCATHCLFLALKYKHPTIDFSDLISSTHETSTDRTSIVQRRCIRTPYNHSTRGRSTIIIIWYNSITGAQIYCRTI